MMTGLRQGELLGLRWRDVDWSAARLRVRRAYVRRQFGSPKSKRSAHQADDALVFAHLQLGRPLDRSGVLKRFKAAAARAGLERVRFHDLRHTSGTRMAAAGVRRGRCRSGWAIATSRPR